MAAPQTSKRRAEATFTGLFLITLAVLLITNTIWPGILLAVGIPMALKQWMRGRVYDAFLSIVIFGGLFALAIVNWDWSLVAPVVLTIAGIYILFREYFTSRQRVGMEEIEDVKQEIIDENDEEQHRETHPRR